MTFNQLQLRLLGLLFLLFTSAVFSYRYFVELPKLEESITKLSERERDTLTFSISNILDSLYRLNFDYAVWTSTYEFMRSKNQNYIDENIVNNTFVSLEIDGIFYIDEHLKPLLVQGFDHKKQIPLNFSFYDFEKNPNNINMLPDASTATEAPKKVGFIKTQYGTAMYSATQIRNSDMMGEHRGFLIMLRLLGPDFVDTLSKYTLTHISYSPIQRDADLPELKSWDEKATDLKVTPYSLISLGDSNDQTLSIIKMQHSTGALPSLVNQQSMVFIILMSLFIYLAHRLVVVFIIEPVSRLTTEIKSLDNFEKGERLNEHYIIRELAAVSKNVNQLLATLKQQNEVLLNQANTDQLTQVMNRRGLINELNVHKDLCTRKGIGFILVMVDVDHFKPYNDTVGHLAGDTALIEVAKTLNEQCKRSADICARYGGEEFTLLFSEMSEKDLNKKLNEIIYAMQILNLAHPCSPTAKHITVSMGAVIIRKSEINRFELSLNDVFKAADNGLYKAKGNGRNCFVIEPFISD